MYYVSINQTYILVSQKQRNPQFYITGDLSSYQALIHGYVHSYFIFVKLLLCAQFAGVYNVYCAVWHFFSILDIIGVLTTFSFKPRNS